MPTNDPIIGWEYDIYEPSVDALIDLGYTVFRVYSSATEGGSYALLGTVTLVAADYAYSYANTSGLATDWVYHVPYGATPGEGAASEPVAISRLTRTTRALIRQGVGKLTRSMQLLTVLATSGGPSGNAVVPSATTFSSEQLVSPDASVNSWCNFFLRSYSGQANNLGEVRRVRAASATGYAPMTGALITVAFPTAFVAGDVNELWRPRGMYDPSVEIDEACNRARIQMQVEDHWYFVTRSNTSEYVVPALVRSARVTRIQIANGTFPDDPQWEDVGAARFTGDVLSIHANGFGDATYGADEIVRVTYLRVPDRLDSDSDYWTGVELEWAIAEVALEYAAFPGLAGLLESTADMDKMLERLGQSVAHFRREYGGDVKIRMEHAV